MEKWVKPLVCSAVIMVAAVVQARQEICLNADWKFKPDEIDVGQPINDAEWQTVQLPHDAAVYGGFSKKKTDSAQGWLPRGSGTYRKNFRLPKGAEGKEVYVDFQGVYRDSEVWINGTSLGRNLNGYLGFEYNLTPHLDLDGENTLVVSFDNTKPKTSRWYTGEGIYRDVKMKLVSPVHVPRHGTYVTTPKIAGDRAIVRIETAVQNNLPQQEFCTLTTEIISPANKKVAEATAVLPVAGGRDRLFTQEIRVDNPECWQVLNAKLYKALSKVEVGGKLVDQYETVFGIREITMTPDKGLAVNGIKVVAKGGNLHHDLGCLGSAALKAGYEKHIDELIAIGCNSVRLSHNPHAPALLEVCDEKGVLVFNEAYDKLTSQFYGGDASFDSQWRTDLSRFVRRDRNHPCVYVWSMGNEVLKQRGQHDPLFETKADAADFGAGLLRRMVDYAHALDPSRKVTAGLFPAREKFIREWEHWDDYETFKNSRPAEMAFEMDVVSWNYTENMFETDHANYPQFMFIASESSSNLEFGNRKNSWLELNKEYVIGHYYWSAYDYLGESAWPKKVWGRSLIDLSGWVTPLGRMYESFYSEKSMVHIMVKETAADRLEFFEKTKNKRWDWYPMADHWNWEPKRKMEVTTFTNCEKVELLLNGRSLGKQKLAKCKDCIMDWEVPFEEGTLKAVAWNGGKKVAGHELKTAGKPHAIELLTSKKKLSNDGQDLAYIDARIVDADGNLVPVHGSRISFDVGGAGFNAGVANGNIISDELWQADSRSTWYGRCRLVVRSKNKSGKIKIKATAKGLPEASLTLKTD